MLKKILEFGHMVRFSHSLFAMPFALGSMWVAANGFRDMTAAETARIVLLIVGCMVTARNSAMSFNRIADADIDAKNPRTAKRHLPAGRLSKKSVIAFLAINGVLFVAFAFLLQPLAGMLALPVWLLLLSYSYWKRFSWLCHWFLGFAIGMSPLGAWIAIRGEFAVFPIFLLVILMLWMGGFDIIYATQDEEIDRQMGLHSVPARFGRKRMIQCGVALLAGSFAVAFMVKNLNFVAYVLFALVGVAWSMINVNSYPMVVEISKSGDVGKYTGYYYTFSMAAQVLTPILSGALLEHVGYWTLFPYAFIMLTLAMFTMSRVRHGDSKPEAPKSALEAFDAGDD